MAAANMAKLISDPSANPTTPHHHLHQQPRSAAPGPNSDDPIGGPGRIKHIYNYLSPWSQRPGMSTRYEGDADTFTALRILPPLLVHGELISNPLPPGQRRRSQTQISDPVLVAAVRRLDLVDLPTHAQSLPIPAQSVFPIPSGPAIVPARPPTTTRPGTAPASYCPSHSSLGGIGGGSGVVLSSIATLTNSYGPPELARSLSGYGPAPDATGTSISGNSPFSFQQRRA
ncbi:hypothetical protein BGW80DRAFT_1462362 [Lactifluus volemus]|nr:hypothetical protein BGW80DRAFT_1462362 [Lactifluus volemus]